MSGREATTTGGRGERSKRKRRLVTFFLAYPGVAIYRPSFAHTKDGEDKPGSLQKSWNLRNFNMRSGMEFPKTNQIQDAHGVTLLTLKSLVSFPRESCATLKSSEGHLVTWKPLQSQLGCVVFLWFFVRIGIPRDSSPFFTTMEGRICLVGSLFPSIFVQQIQIFQLFPSWRVVFPKHLQQWSFLVGKPHGCWVNPLF